MTLALPGISDSLRRADLRAGKPSAHIPTCVFVWGERGELVEEPCSSMAALRKRQKQNRAELVGWLGWEPQGARTGEIAQLLRAQLAGRL